jgi:hypothetical protein
MDDYLIDLELEKGNQSNLIVNVEPLVYVSTGPGTDISSGISIDVSSGSPRIEFEDISLGDT